MTIIRRVLLVVALLAAVGAPAPLRAQPQEQQGEFVPAESLPQREQVPAAPLLVGAYAFVLLALFGYVVSVSRRISGVKADIARLEAEVTRGSRG